MLLTTPRLAHVTTTLLLTFLHSSSTIICQCRPNTQNYVSTPLTLFYTTHFPIALPLTNNYLRHLSRSATFGLRLAYSLTPLPKNEKKLDLYNRFSLATYYFNQTSK
jgi:hypothetical protein